MRKPLNKFSNRNSLYSLLGVLFALTIPLQIASGQIVMAVGITARAEIRGESETKDIAQLATKLTDVEATVRVTKFDSAELEKIGQDFKSTYSLRNLNFQYKQPNKIRMEAHSPTRGNALLVMNGPLRYYEVAKFKIHNTENLESKPGRRQSMLEYAGLLSPGTLEFMEGKYVREEPLAGKPKSVFELRYRGETKGSYYRLWFDRVTQITSRREWYDSTGKLRATFTYSEPQDLGSNLWMPGKIEVKNGDGILAAILTITNIKINQGLEDTLFAIKQ